MPSDIKILYELNCPRCNAKAQLRVEDQHANMCLLYIVCDKCKLRKYQGIATRKAVNLMKQEIRILKKLEFILPGPHRSRLELLLERTRKAIQKSYLMER